MYYKILLVAAYVFRSVIGWAQDKGSLPKYEPIAPNAASLFKLFEKPAGSFTGVPPVSIPVHVGTNKGFSLPVSLSYSAGGIKVEEYASPVGLGWVLSAGGMVTRIQKGIADEMHPVGYLHNGYKPSQFTGSQTHLSAYSNGGFDMEPDLFLFSVNGLSGKFVFNESGNLYVLQASENVKVKPIYDGPYNQVAAFTITDERGFVYYMGLNKNKTVIAKDLTTGADAHYTGWHLLQVFDMNGIEVANLEYENVNSSNSARSIAAIPYNFGLGTVMGCTSSDYAVYNNFTGGAVYEKILKKITIGPEIIVFNQGSRLDGSSVRINSIEIRDAANTVRKKFNLNYAYFGEPYTPAYSYLGETAYNARFRRLKLKSFSQQPASGNDSLTYTFTYEENVNLPDRFGTSIDYWGYFNGKYNTSTVPEGIYTYDGNTKGITGYGDRRADPAYSIANTLKKISFPSGGYREFEFEGNQALYPYSPYNSGDLRADKDDHLHRTFDTTVFNESNPGVIPQYRRYFTVNSTNGYTLFFFNLEGYGEDFTVKLFHAPNSVPFVTFTDEFEGYYLLANGNYKLDFNYDPDGCSFDAISCYWDELNLTGNTITRYDNSFRKAHQAVGGLRIKTIDDYDPVTAKHQYTRYKYYLPTDTTLTSGMLVSYPRLLYRSACPSKQCDLIRIAAQSCYPLNSDGGAYVVYPHVRVIEDNNGYTDTYFSFVYDAGWDDMDFPAPTPFNNSYQRGSVLSKKYFSQGGTLLRKDSVEYLYAMGENPPYTTSRGVNLVLHSVFPAVYCYDVYDNYPTGTPQPKKELSTVYDASGNHETKAEYSYFHALNKMGLNQAKLTRSDGNTKETWHRYAYNAHTDFKFGLSAGERSMKDTLLAKNYLAPLEVTSFLKKAPDSTFIEGVKTIFGYYHTTRKHPASIRKFTSLTDSTVINFSVYDTATNVQEQYITNDLKEVYLWGYNNNYVVAKITGSDYSTVAALVNNAVLQNPASETALRTELNNIRTGLAATKAQVITYTYLPGVGISSMTDANNRTIYYEYDLHTRLVRIRDHNKNIIKKFSYSIAQ